MMNSPLLLIALNLFLGIKGESTNTLPSISCDIFTNEYCSDEEKKYVETARERFGGFSDILEWEISRIDKDLEKGSFGERQIDWAQRRRNIVYQLLGEAEAEEEL